MNKGIDPKRLCVGCGRDLELESASTVMGQEFDLVSQLAHVFSGICFGFFPAHFGLSLWIVVPLWLAVFAAKEFWYDYRYESAAVRGSSLKDFCFCVLGLAMGVGLYVVGL